MISIYYKQFYGNIFENLDETGNLLYKYHLTEWIPDVRENMISSVLLKNLKSSKSPH